MTFYITTAIPYVNAAPHLGHALELVQADVLARHRRSRGEPVRFLTGTDDNAIKNVAAARAAGVDVPTFVGANAARFAALRERLQLSFDDFLSTSADPRHRPGVERLWRESAARGDFYPREYEGLYCTGCEQFRVEDRCPEHPGPLERVAERNWFFRLSAYAGRIADLIESGRVRVGRRAEVLAFVRGGLSDISVSRPAARAGGWGIPVPGDPAQVIYVWWDALANYITALGYGTDDPAYRTWWVEADERVHVIGKGIVRFHAVYWLALLLSAGEPPPTTVHVHDYLTVEGAKLSKSAGNAIDPAELAARYGGDAVRWWLVREPAPDGDTDFRAERLVRRSDQDLAGGIGNLVSRVLGLARRRRTPHPGTGRDLAAALPAAIDRALTAFDLRAATGAILSVVREANRVIETERPWEPGGDALVGDLLTACRVIADELSPFLPDAAERLRRLLDSGEPAPAFRPLQPRAVRR
jgi:methionyl-tRNA synthetase